ncbi:MAG TPA: endonuclease/exonuclease/phosphatase family protein [Thermoanaerobaculia bacterium]|nr:endonuclease/exonuclease/phosphatase family protein [Thermoanaerobaculia bacterium]
MLHAFLAGLVILPIVFTLLSFVPHPHWIFRLWDFPRVQIAAVALIGAIAYYYFFFEEKPWQMVMLGLALTVLAWQEYRIHPYTPFVRKTVEQAGSVDPANRITLLMANVEMENEDHGLLLDTIRREDPDLVLAVEINARWMSALEPLSERYRHSVKQPQENWYGMVVFSRLELIKPRVEYLVQDDIPSIRTRVRLRSGVEVVLRGLHPRPPEPLRDQSSAPRDAELIVAGREIERGEKVPTIVAGDLNDVAWSPTSQLFVRLSGLLDPRVGRGFYNSFNARNPLARYPLDHVFHSNHFKLVDLRRLPSIGSDHFPILITLQYEAQAAAEQDESEKKAGDETAAEEKLERAAGES